MGASKDFPRNIFENYNVLGVSSELRESGLNLLVAIDKQFVFEKGNILQNEALTELNEDEITGREEPTDIFYKGARTSAFNLSLPRAQAQHLLHILAFALSGNVTTIGVGAAGYKHVITPGECMSPHTFTGCFQEAAIQKTLFASLMYENAEITFEKEAFVKATAGIRGTGKNSVNWLEETVTASGLAVSLSLASSVSENLISNIHSIMITKADGAQYPLQASSVSGQLINLEASAGDGADNRVYKVIYVNSECSWDNIPARIAETPLRVSDLRVNIGGKFNGTDIIGGIDINHEIQKLTYKLDQPQTIEARPCAAGENADFANYVVRGTRKQTVTLDRDFKDVLMQAKLRNAEYFALKILCEGAEFETGVKFTLQIILPRIAATKAARTSNNGILTEGNEMQVLDDPAGTYKSIYATIINKQSKVAALV